MTDNVLILASSSPQRKNLLEMACIPFSVESHPVDETFDNNLSIEQNLRAVAYKKAFVTAEKNIGKLVLAADTIVVAGGQQNRQSDGLNIGIDCEIGHELSENNKSDQNSWKENNHKSSEIVLGKPKNDDDARESLRLISSYPHKVMSGVCLLRLDYSNESDEYIESVNITFIESTEIIMTKMSEDDIDWYISTREHEGKAGAYAIQGKGGVFVEKIVGDYFNVIGLPINRLYRELKKLGVY